MGSSKPYEGTEAGRPAAAEPRRARCPICSAPNEAAFRPFCSRRCADVDLSRWLRGGYAIPGRIDADEDGDDTIAATGMGRALAPGEEPGEEPGDKQGKGG